MWQEVNLCKYVRPSELKVGDIFAEKYVVFECVRKERSTVWGRFVGYIDDKQYPPYHKQEEEIEFFGDDAYGPQLYLISRYWKPESNTKS
jgi:hypothetical protein